MKRLNSENLAAGIPNTKVPTYKRDEVKPGIVHFGVGNFHRTHQAVYCDDLLCQGERNWGITGISMRSGAVRDALAPQDFLYTQVTLGTKKSFRIIGSILNILLAPDDPTAVIDAVASNQTKIVTTTITEKGYCLSSGEIDVNSSGFHQDLSTLAKPQTIYGYLAAAIIKRCSNNGPGLTIICCDNVRNGGSHLESGVHKILAAHSPSTLDWVAQQIAFASSMVDRVTPSTDDALRQLVTSHHDHDDAWPVAAEPFSQWIIQDVFPGPRPPFDAAGALFVEDVAPYELMKLRFLNAAHSMISALGYLYGDQFVHKALEHPPVLEFVKLALNDNVLPVSPVPKGIDALNYIDQILDRFRNHALPYGVLQVGADSSQKIQQRLLPTIDDAIKQESNTGCLAFALAAWVEYILKALQKNELNDPLQKKFARAKLTGDQDITVQFLKLAGAGNFCFFQNANFMVAVKSHQQTISEIGVETALISFLEPTAKEANYA